MTRHRELGTQAHLRSAVDVMVVTAEHALHHGVLARVCEVISSLSLRYQISKRVGSISDPALVLTLDGWDQLSLVDAAAQLVRLAPAAHQLAVATDTTLMVETALNAGFDDCVIWPVRAEELLARIKVGLRRSNPPPPSVISLDPDRLLASSGFGSVRLTTAQFRLLRHLLDACQAWVSSAELASSIAGARRVGRTPVAIHVHALRKKLGPEAWRLQSERALGYRFDVSSQSCTDGE